MPDWIVRLPVSPVAHDDRWWLPVLQHAKVWERLTPDWIVRLPVSPVAHDDRWWRAGFAAREVIKAQRETVAFAV
jgi:hypothetical protein